MSRETPIRLVLCDVGGVVLSNGWDSASRRRVIDHFDLDWEEFTERHESVVDRFETGRIGIDDYVRLTVVHRTRGFAIGDFAERMRAQSVAKEGGPELAADLAASGLPCVTLNNESRPLNDHRVATFGLHDYFDAFFTSGYLGVKKPDDRIYRIATEVMAVPAQHCVFIDDRALNLEPAAAMGMHTVHHVDPATTRRALDDLGLDLSHDED